MAERPSIPPEVIIRAREAKNLKRRDVARGSGVSVYTVKAWELGYRKPTLATFRRAARLLGISLDEWIRDESE